jgi:hypothetical protein
MAVIDMERMNEEVNVKLTRSDIEELIRCMEDSPHGVFEFMGYDKIVKKLKEAQNDSKKNSNS